MKTQNTWDKFYLGVAASAAQMSYAEDRKVGAIIVKDGNIISFSYNGTPPGNDNSTEKNGVTLSSVLHAEAQAIAKVAQSTTSSKGATLYCTLSPCVECAKLIIGAGIRRVVFDQLYKDTSGINLLDKNGVLTNDSDENHNRLIPIDQLRHTGLL